MSYAEITNEIPVANSLFANLKTATQPLNTVVTAMWRLMTSNVLEESSTEPLNEKLNFAFESRSLSHSKQFKSYIFLKNFLYQISQKKT